MESDKDVMSTHHFAWAIQPNLQLTAGSTNIIAYYAQY